MAVTWANIKSLFYQTIGDTEGVNLFFSKAQVLDFGQACIREAAERTHFYDYAVTEQAIDAGTETVNVSLQAVEVWRVEIDNEYVRPITADQIRRHDRFWRSRTGTIDWYLLDEYQTDPERITLRFFPIPTAETTYTLYAYAIPTLPSDANDTLVVSVPEWFAYSLLFGMLARAYSVDSQMQNKDIAAVYRVMWDDAVMRLRQRSFGRLGGAWEVRDYDADASLSIWNRLPESITPP